MNAATVWVLWQRPSPELPRGEVSLATVSLPPLTAGTVRVRNLAMSLEPYLWGRVTGQATYAAPFALGEPLRGPAVGVVEASTVSWLPPGTCVLHNSGWRDVALLTVSECTLVGTSNDPLLSLSVLGLAGMTAWVGLRKIAQIRSGDRVFVSSAAGAVGSAAVQLARAAGCTVVGSAGSSAKCTAVLELGAHASFNYRDGAARTELKGALERAGAQGVDVYFDNVGGEQLEAAIGAMNMYGRIALCGMTSVYDEPQPGPRNLLKAVWNRVRMEGFLLRDHEASRSEFLAEMTALISAGEVCAFDTFVPGGLGGAWQGYNQMQAGGYTGKAIVTL